MAFFRFLLIIVIVYYLLKLIGRYVVPFLVVSRVQKVNEAKRREYDEYIARKKAEEGKVTINNHGNGTGAQKRNAVNESEYVDYEEIE
ncbi:MAG: DUF4834 family protein [Cytophagaceae bacterium]|jgi:hypothetical protein|nr:DUF4834 family protein [Cytophagaceae bacterium]